MDGNGRKEGMGGTGAGGALSRYHEVEPYRTKDGSVIRELMHPRHHASWNQSLAEAEVPPGGRTLLHRHLNSEELYHFLSGSGEMRLGEQRFPVGPGDTVCIPPGTPHALWNRGSEPLRLLCACAPPYDHADTRLLEPEEG